MASQARLLWIGLLFLVSACADMAGTSHDGAKKSAVDFNDLPGWQQDHVQESIPALIRSCAVLNKKRDWSELCAALTAAPPKNDEQARRFLQRWFQPYALQATQGSEGLFTGYYEAQLQGSHQRGGAYQIPLYARPDDLVEVDLGAFRPELKGQHIAGKVIVTKKSKQLAPYDDRAQIVSGSLNQRAQPLVWVRDPVDAFFLAIQGSGRVQLPDNEVMRLGYDAANGHAYMAVGRILADRNEIAKPVTMQSIRVWMTAHPDRAAEIMNLNPSYVFFRVLQGEGPVGAEGVALTPQRSLAVDPAYIALGSPVWIDTVDGKGQPLQRLMIAQDTGGAIKGAVRGDVFWGYGSGAEVQAGAMQGKGHAFVLIPRVDMTNVRS